MPRFPGQAFSCTIFFPFLIYVVFFRLSRPPPPPLFPLHSNLADLGERYCIRTYHVADRKGCEFRFTPAPSHSSIFFIFVAFYLIIRANETLGIHPIDERNYGSCTFQVSAETKSRFFAPAQREQYHSEGGVTCSPPSPPPPPPPPPLALLI